MFNLLVLYLLMGFYTRLRMESKYRSTSNEWGRLNVRKGNIWTKTFCCCCCVCTHTIYYTNIIRNCLKYIFVRNTHKASRVIPIISSYMGVFFPNKMKFDAFCIKFIKCVKVLFILSAIWKGDWIFWGINNCCEIINYAGTANNSPWCTRYIYTDRILDYLIIIKSNEVVGKLILNPSTFRTFSAVLR